MSILLVLASGIAHAIWNLFAKRSDNKRMFLLLILVPSTLALLPMLTSELMRYDGAAQGYILLALSMAVQAGYGFFLSRSLALGDMSQVYPMMRGIGAFLLPLIGTVVLGERLSWQGWIGLACIAGGFCFTSGILSRRRRRTIPLRAVWHTAGVGICAMSYVLIDKLNLQHFAPLPLLEASNIGFMLGLLPFIRKKELRAAFRGGRDSWLLLLLGSVLSPGSYFLFLLAMNLSQLAYVAPLREIGTVFGAVAGMYLLRERKEAVRLVSAGMIFAGILLVGIWNA